VIPKGFVASFEVEFFSAPSGGPSLVAQEANLFQTLAHLKPSSEMNAPQQRNETNRCTLTVTVHHAPSFPLGADLSVLTGRNFPFITVELYQNDQVVSSGTAVRLPMKPFTGSSATFFGRLVAAARAFDVRNLSVFKKFQFQSLEPGRYLVKVFKENTFFRTDRRYIGYATVDLEHNEMIQVSCTREGSGRVILTDQHGNGLQGALVSLRANDIVIAENMTDQQGTAHLTAPCGITKEYTLQVLYKGFVVESERVPFHVIRTVIPLVKSLQIEQYDWTFTLVDNWGLPPAIEITPRLSSDDMKQPTLLPATQQEPGVYTYTGLLPALYHLQLQYKSFSIEENVTIPASEASFVFPAAFPITFHVLDSHGLDLNDATITINRSGKTAELIHNSSSTQTSLPPGDYTISVVSNNVVIGRRPLTISGERTIDLVTTQGPLFPLVIIIIIIALGGMLFIYSIKKKDPILLLSLLAVCLAVVACVLPWWSLAGRSSEANTSSVLYLVPPQLVTITRTASVVTGELAYAPDLFITVMAVIPAVIAFGCLLCFASLAFKRIDKKRIQLLLILAGILLFVGSLTAFSFAITTYSQAGVGSFLGEGTVDVSVPGINTPVPILCHWGPAEGFIVFIVTIIILLAALLLSIIQKKR
jgi:hypothetical protein